MGLGPVFIVLVISVCCRIHRPFGWIRIRRRHSAKSCMALLRGRCGLVIVPRRRGNVKHHLWRTHSCVQRSHSCERDMFHRPSVAIATNRAGSPESLRTRTAMPRGHETARATIESDICGPPTYRVQHGTVRPAAGYGPVVRHRLLAASRTASDLRSCMADGSRSPLAPSRRLR